MNIVILRYGQLGDVVLSSALIESLYRYHNIYLATKEIYSGLYIEDIRVKKMFFLKNDSPKSIFEHIKDIKTINPELIFDIYGKLRSIIISKFLKVKTIKYYSFRKERKKILQTKDIKDIIPHSFQWYLNCLKKVDIQYDRVVFPNLYISQKIPTQINKIINNNKWIAIHLHSKKLNRVIPSEIVKYSVEKLRKEGFNFLLIGNKSKDKLEVDLDLRDKLSLSELKTLLSKCLLLISSDSGPLHISEAVGTPVVGIYGAASSNLGFAPFMKSSKIVEIDIPCRPCSLHGSDICYNNTMDCILKINPETIFLKTKELIENCNLSS